MAFAKKTMRAGLNSVTGRLFPETRDLLDDDEELGGELTITNTEIASSLPLQMLLYFNIQFSIFWGLIILALMVVQESYFQVNTAYRVLSPLLLSVWFMIEPLRLFFGYVGNLQEKVPQLTGFWLFTLIPQLPITFFFIVALPLRVNGQSIQLPFQRAGSIILMCLSSTCKGRATTLSTRRVALWRPEAWLSEKESMLRRLRAVACGCGQCGRGVALRDSLMSSVRLWARPALAVNRCGCSIDLNLRMC
ncbi:MAG: transmembrane 17 domain-containing protein [Promethearchaeia archaeon]